LAVFLAPAGIRPRLSAEARPNRVIVALFHWLLFRLMFSSGAVKLLSGDLAWRDLTALSVHYETQPLPTWAGWYVHQLPFAFHAVSAVLLFVIELAVPWLVFRRGARSIACAILLLFQVLIAVTGNYGFFNLLTVGLCLLLLEDRQWPARWRRLAEASRAAEPERRRGWPGRIVAPVAVVVIFASALEMSRLLGVDSFWPRPALRVARLLAPFEIVNGYGLFAVMTVTRDEIVVEGSRDGASWSAYEFRWKPGDVDRRPAFVGLHMPRLDWQMWFAALGTVEQSPWFLSFLSRLLEGSPDVTALLATNPFPDGPPRYVRATLYRYRFTAMGGGKAWWRRERIGSYAPVISLRER
ncbi:MAG: lipase maturation factor family protein, partial [Candidatus Binatia bacterium]